jgi:1,4-dihydroxy-6-naphthoate synthase
MPIPLGGIFASHQLDPSLRDQVEVILRQSIEYAYEHPEQTMDYVRQYAQEMDEAVMQQHINLYVNEFSLDLGEVGRKAVSLLKKNLVPGLS